MAHWVAGIDIPSAPMTAVAAETPVGDTAFAAFYKARGVHYLPTVCDGDCGLDLMCLIMGSERTLHARNSLRVELFEYLIKRLHQPWMIDILVVTQEIDINDVNIARSEEIQIGQELNPHPGEYEAAVPLIPLDRARTSLGRGNESNAMGIQTRR